METTRAAPSSVADELAAEDLIDEILGLPKNRTEAQPKHILVTNTVSSTSIDRQAGQDAPAAASMATASGRLNGRIVSVNMNTATVDIEFEGPRRPTVGSQFSVHHDYALSTSHVGRLEVVYLAGNGRAIAKPAGRTDLAKVGKGDRINGRIVSGKASEPQTASPVRSCVAPPSGIDMPVPPPDPSVPTEPYVPDDSAPSPGDEFQAAGPKFKSLLTSWMKSSGDEPNPAFPTSADRTAPSGNSWAALFKPSHDRPKNVGSTTSSAPGIVLLED